MNGDVTQALLLFVGWSLATYLLLRWWGHLLVLLPLATRAWLRWRRPGSEPIQEALTDLINVLQRKPR